VYGPTYMRYRVSVDSTSRGDGRSWLSGRQQLAGRAARGVVAGAVVIKCDSKSCYGRHAAALFVYC